MTRQATRIGLFGGVYSNALALQALLQDAGRRGLSRLYCLGDLGAFGPHPDHVCDVLRATGIPVVQGNYDYSVGNGLADCQCGYTDPRDNYFAKLSYDYTFRKTSAGHKRWLAQLPAGLRLTIGPWRVLLCHGSPRKTNEFLWETTTSDAFLAWLFARYECDVIVATHTGLPWTREISLNAGCLGNTGEAGGVTRSGWFAPTRQPGRFGPKWPAADRARGTGFGVMCLLCLCDTMPLRR